MNRIGNSRVHFVGIGGAGMSGLAELIHNMGAKVSGSDLNDSPVVERLKGLGIKTYKGHSEHNVEDVDVVVYSSAVPFSNPEIREAKSRQIPIIPRIEVLAEVMRLKRGVAVGGTHGKTTTTSMLASIFIHAKQDPTVVVGGRLDLIKSHSFLGKGDWLIAESDESDGSFLKLSPEIAVITNIDNDHLDHYKSYENLKTAFLDFARLVPFYGCTVACGDSSDVREALSQYNKKVLYYGFNENNDLQICLKDKEVYIRWDGQLYGPVQLQVPGRHNLLNATAAIGVSIQAGLTIENAINGLKLYNGVDRRFQFKGQVGKLKVYDDYGHHPTEVAATLQAFRERFPSEKLIVLFQPHRYSRTQICWNDFLNVFNEADEVFLFDIYAASESPIEGITSQKLAEQIVHPNCRYIGKGEEALSAVVSRIQKNINDATVLVTLGAGDITKRGPELLEKL